LLLEAIKKIRLAPAPAGAAFFFLEVLPPGLAV
jgi:hypothetical protein